MKIAYSSFLVAVLALAGATIQAQPVSETFDNGFPGTAPLNGWVSPWTNSANVLTPTVTGGNPLDNGGNYLTYTQTSGSDSSLRRAYSGLLNTAAQIIRVTYRVDDFSGTFTTNQYVTITDGDNLGVGGSSSGSSFIIRAFGQSPGVTLPAMRWGFYSGEKARLGYNPANWVDSGMDFSVGQTYAFTITLRPASLTYDVLISNLTTAVTTTNTNLGFRDNSLGATNVLVFNARTAGSGNNEIIALDSISVDYLGGVPPVVLHEDRSGDNVLLTWPAGVLLEATAITGPWTTNVATSPYTAPISPAVPRKFYRVIVQ